MINKKIALTGAIIASIAPMISVVSCGPSYDKDSKQWGSENFAASYDNLSYKDEADNAMLINEINYDLPRANSMYQMLVYAFADGNDDGIGDFIGAKEKLSYLNELGIDQIWLSPIHPASSYHGYDVIDYTKVAPEFGGMEAFDNFLKKAHELNIKVYLDIVLNHTSYEHPWFQKALEDPSSKYRNYYRFQDNNEQYNDLNKLGYDFTEKYINPSTRKTPSSVPYISKFWGGMPDLNLDNPEVIKELENVQRFWVKKGVDGFRYDAFYEFFSSIGETQDNYNIQKIMANLREAGEKGKTEAHRNAKFDQFMMGEWWSNINTSIQYFKDGNRRALDTTYDHSHWAGNWFVKSDVNDMKQSTSFYTNQGQYNQWVPFLDNHDMERWITEYRKSIRNLPGEKLRSAIDQKDVNAMSTALFSLLTRPANPIIFQGDELAYHGMKDTDPKLREPMRWNSPKYNIDFWEKRSGKDERISLNLSSDRPSADSQINSISQPAYYVKKLNQWRKTNPFIGKTDPTTVAEASNYVRDISDARRSNIFVRQNSAGTKKFLVAFSFERDVTLSIKNNINVVNTPVKSQNAELNGKNIKLSPNSFIIIEINN